MPSAQRHQRVRGRLRRGLPGRLHLRGPSTRPAAGSTPCSRVTRWCSAPRPTVTSSASVTSSTPTARRCPSRRATSSTRSVRSPRHGPTPWRNSCSAGSPCPGVDEGIRETTRHTRHPWMLQLLRHLRGLDGRVPSRRLPPAPSTCSTGGCSASSTTRSPPSPRRSKGSSRCLHPARGLRRRLELVRAPSPAPGNRPTRSPTPRCTACSAVAQPPAAVRPFLADELWRCCRPARRGRVGAPGRLARAARRGRPRARLAHGRPPAASSASAAPRCWSRRCAGRWPATRRRACTEIHRAQRQGAAKTSTVGAAHLDGGAHLQEAGPRLGLASTRSSRRGRRKSSVGRGLDRGRWRAPRRRRGRGARHVPRVVRARRGPGLAAGARPRARRRAGAAQGFARELARVLKHWPRHRPPCHRGARRHRPGLLAAVGVQATGSPRRPRRCRSPTSSPTGPPRTLFVGDATVAASRPHLCPYGLPPRESVFGAFRGAMTPLNAPKMRT